MSDPMNDVKAAFVLAAEHANAASAEAASRIFDAALAAHDEEVREEAANDGWKEGFDAGFADHKEGYDAGYAKGCADEREKAVERLRAEVVLWMHKCESTENCLVCLHANLAVAAARGDGNHA